MKRGKLIRRVTPKQRLINDFREKVERRATPILKQHVSLRDLATEGWSSENKPKIRYFIKNKRNTKNRLRLEVVVYARPAKGSKKGLSVYRLLSDGTKIRHALMPFNFQSKTKPGRLGKFGEGGKPIAISKKIKKPGIEPRHFDEIINDTLEEPMKRALRVPKRKR